MTALLHRLWRLMRGSLQWRVLWLLNSKFIVNASGVCLDGEGRVLLLRHRFWPEDTWGIPGGYIHSGEVAEQALRREVREETGLSLRVDSLLRANTGYRLRVELAFLARVTGGRAAPRQPGSAGGPVFPSRRPAGRLASGAPRGDCPGSRQVGNHSKTTRPVLAVIADGFGLAALAVSATELGGA